MFLRGEKIIMTTIESEVFSSFLAGYLYKNRIISCFDISQSIVNFEETYNIDVTEPSSDYLKLNNIINFNDYSIRLIREYSDTYNGMTVREYLYSLTTPTVREYFGIPDDRKINNTLSRKKLMKCLFNNCFIKRNM